MPVGIGPVRDDPGQGGVPGSWTQPAEPKGSVFAGRRPSGRPFGRRDSGGSGRGTATKSRSTELTPAGRTPRRAQLQVARLEPWSVMKFSFVMSLVCFVILLVAVVVLYVIMSGLGVFDALSNTLNDLTRDQNDKTGGIDAGSWFSFARVFGYTVLVGALNVLLITALSTVGSVIYNQAADLVGGVEITLKESE